jgi:hypothetical protein
MKASPGRWYICLRMQLDGAENRELVNVHRDKYLFLPLVWPHGQTGHSGYVAHKGSHAY